MGKQRKGTDGAWQRLRDAQDALNFANAKASDAMADRDEAVWALYQQGASTYQIADFLKVSASSVSRAIARFEKNRYY